MAVSDHSSPALLDGALPLIALLAVAMLLGGDAGLPVHAVTALYLVFAAGIATGGAERPGEPFSAWRLYAGSMALLAVGLPFGGPWSAPGLVLFGAGFVVHLVAKASHGIVRIGLLSACGRRAHDARVGRRLEAAALVLAAAVLFAQPALFAVAGWLVTAAAVPERPTREVARRPQPRAAVPAQVA